MMAAEGLNLWAECQRRNWCRNGLGGVDLRHVPTGERFECRGSVWGPDSMLLVYSWTDRSAKYRADECVLMSRWPVVCCRPTRKVS